MNPDRALALARVAACYSQEGEDAATSLLQSEYPFDPLVPVRRSYGRKAMLQVFVRDGFRDRYRGERLVFPGALHLLSWRLPSAFPYHPHWKVDLTHSANWQLCATIDHVVPVSRGGEDAESNRVTTSMLRNSSKAHWTLEELGWTLYPEGSFAEWDGFLGWFVDEVVRSDSEAQPAHIQEWLRVARRLVP